MFSRNERKIFELAKRSKQNKVSYQEMKDSIGIGHDDAKSACNSLIEKGYASEKYYSPIPGSSIPWGIVLSEKGRHRLRYVIELFISFLVKSVIVPIVVAFITTLITIWLTGFFGG